MSHVGSWIIFVNDFLCYDVKCRCPIGTLQRYLLVYHFFFFFVLQIYSSLDAGKTPATEKCTNSQSSLSYGDRQLDLEEAGQAKDNCGMEYRG